jgi:endonuclease/exonuclease/phosphatase family metal-dependent hydrolase
MQPAPFSGAGRRLLTAGMSCLLHVAFCVSCSHPPPRAVPVVPGVPDLAIVTWNLHGDAGDVAALAADLRSGRLTGGTPPREVVLMLQEASPRTYGGERHVFFAAARRVKGIDRGNAILSSLPFVAARAIELPRERQRRVAAVATVRLAGADLTLANVHLENRASWWKGALPGDRARARQMNALLAELPPGPGVLGGDLNIWLGTREEAYRDAAATFPDGPGPQPILTFRERLALDHLFYRLPAGWKASTHRAPERYGSDHFPVVGVLVNN